MHAKKRADYDTSIVRYGLKKTAVRDRITLCFRGAFRLRR